MRMVFMALLVSVSASAQSRDELHARYGAPVSETFEVRTGIFATATYARSGEVCEIVIMPQQLTMSLDYPSSGEIESNLMTEVVDGLVPKKDRGKRLIPVFVNIQCLPLNNCQGTEDNYEQLTIFHNGGNGNERYARIQWNISPCQP